jgi:hypothetical protein
MLTQKVSRYEREKVKSELFMTGVLFFLIIG